MGLGVAFINSKLFLQKYYPLPLYYRKETSSVEMHPYLVNHTPWKMPLWYIGVLLTTPLVISSIHRLSVVYAEFEPKMAEEFMVYCYLCALVPLYYVTMQYFHCGDTREKSELAKRLYWKGGIYYIGWPWPATNRIPCFQEAFGYVLVFCTLLILPAVGAVLSFYKTYHPITVFFRRFVPDSYEFGAWDKTEIAVITGILLVIDTIPAVIMLLNVMTCVEVLEALTHTNFENGLESQIKKKKTDPIALLWKMARDLCQGKGSWREIFKKLGNRRRISDQTFGKLTQVVTSNGQRRATMKEKFRACKFLHQETYIFVGISNRQTYLYICTACLSGIALAVVSNFGVVRFLGTLEVIIYGLLCFSAVMSTGISCFLCWKASSPSRYSTKLIQYWKGISLSSLEQKQLETLRPIRMTMGPFFQVRKGTALDILSVVQDYTLTFLMGW